MRESRSRRRRSIGNGGGLKQRRKAVRLSLPHSTRSTSHLHDKQANHLWRSMAPWKPRLEVGAREIANGDDVKLEKLMEIISWFAEERDLKEAAGAAYRKLTEAEDWHLTPTGEPEAESDDPKQEMKWRAFRSRHYKPAGPTEFVFGAVMGLPVPVPAEIKPGARKKKAKMPLMLRRSPRFPRRSPRLLSLARSQGWG
ncbi:hypothetical protein VPH35_088388 [Triticum aestivum]